MSPTKEKSEVNKETIELIKQISTVNNEPSCMAKHRLAMFEAYQNEPLADRVTHLWRYSNPADFEPSHNEISLSSIEGTKLFLKVDEKDLNKGIILLPLSKAHMTHGDLISKTFGQLVRNHPGKVTYLNEATWTNGYFLYIPKEVKAECPLKVKIIAEQDNKLEAIRNLIILEEGAAASLIEEITSKEDARVLTNVVTEKFLGKNTKLNYLNLQTHGKQTTHHLFQRAAIEREAELTNLVITLGGKISKADLGAILCEDKATVCIHGIVLGDGNQKFDHHTQIEHIAPHTCSSLDFRVVLKDQARSAYTGNLMIANEAIKSDAYQENRNLLLSHDARADSIPELEILTNDVIRCSHGVTVGRVDKEQIYYLMSRGLSQKEAEKMITTGFLEPTVSRIPDENLKNEILIHLENKLEGL